MAAKQKRCLFFCYFIILLLKGNGGGGGVGASSPPRRRHGHHHHHHHHGEGHDHQVGKRVIGDGFKPNKLFVFGDSYADTGNVAKSMGSSWKVPYGTTFPGKPAGRFSDGRVQTDFLARFLGLKSPLAYRWRNYAPSSILKHGLNFAYGGTGVFNTSSPDPNMTVQIDFLQQLIVGDNDSSSSSSSSVVYNCQDLQASIALVSVAGNDYSYYLSTNGSSPQGLQEFIPKVVAQLTLNLQRIHNLGIKKILVSTLQPLGCLPRSTVPSAFQQCNSTENTFVGLHNLLLQQAVSNLNNNNNNNNETSTTDGGSPFVILNLYDSFMSVFHQKAAPLGSSSFDNPLKPCCVGVNQTFSCGSLDENGMEMYTVCPDPRLTFFWDTYHPTQAGWRAVYSTLQSDLQQIYS